MNKHECVGCNKLNSTNEMDQFIKLNKDQEEILLCETCINSMQHEIMQSKSPTTPVKFSLVNESPMPKDIYNYLNKHVIGQTEAKTKLSIAISQHYRRLKDPSIKKSNLLLIGPTGTGKTELARSISQYLKLPFICADATNLTTRGYIGEDVESIITRLLQSTNWDVQKASQGIIFIDEIDKLARSQNGDSGINTVSVQQELLKIIEGSIVKVKNKNGAMSEEFFVNTNNILFICAGAFDGLKDLVCVSDKEIGMGLTQSKKETSANWTDDIETSHLVKYGLIPEFLGRVPVLSYTSNLTVKDLEQILTEPENSLTKQYKKLLSMDDIELNFSPEYISTIAEEAFSKKLGARGLKQILENRLQKLYFNLDQYKNKSIVVYKDKEVISELETNHFQELEQVSGS